MPELKTPDYNYCANECPIGKVKKDEILRSSDSAIFAAFDMRRFVDQCFKTCEECPKKDES